MRNARNQVQYADVDLTDDDIPCPTCHGRRRTTCPVCAGDGCPDCRRGSVRCEDCDGVGTVDRRGVEEDG